MSYVCFKTCVQAPMMKLLTNFKYFTSVFISNSIKCCWYFWNNSMINFIGVNEIQTSPQQLHRHPRKSLIINMYDRSWRVKFQARKRVVNKNQFFVCKLKRCLFIHRIVNSKTNHNLSKRLALTEFSLNILLVLIGNVGWKKNVFFRRIES